MPVLDSRLEGAGTLRVALGSLRNTPSDCGRVSAVEQNHTKVRIVGLLPHGLRSELTRQASVQYRQYLLIQRHS
jgi:hypothetical protein